MPRKKISRKNINQNLDIKTLGRDQLFAYSKIESTNDNYFITGKAGTGKSVLLSYFASHTKKNVAILAPTGIAALNIGGQTIHSFFRLELNTQNYRNLEKVTDLKDRQIKLINKLDTIIIDEISMVSADIMDMIDAKLRYARGKDLPFGGIQMIVFGDLFQLPPVLPRGGAYEFMRANYRSIYFFDSNVVREHPFTIIELSDVYRQSDPAFINILNRIRLGQVDWDLLNEINSRCCTPPKTDHYITLSSINATADNINASRLSAIPSQEYNYYAKITGELSEREYPASETLKLREGAQVMMLKNDRTDLDAGSSKQRWVNGTLATIAYLDEENIQIDINGNVYTVDLEKWDKYRYCYDEETGLFDKELVATFTQYPLKLAYAITIHKSQGQTYDSVHIDLGRGAFATGQTYVALSRCRSLDNLSLAKPLRPYDIRVDKCVMNWLENSNVLKLN